MTLYDMDGDPITPEKCEQAAVEALEMSHYNAQGDMDRIARALQSIAWLMMADRVREPDKPVHLG